MLYLNNNHIIASLLEYAVRVYNQWHGVRVHILKKD